MYCSYPTETDHFVVPPEVAAIYGEEPKELDIMFPIDDIEEIFPQAYEHYGSGKGLKCTGNGEEAMKYDESSKSMVPQSCPCELLDQKKCSQRGHLLVMLPKVNMGGIYQIDTSSFNSIIDLNSSIDYVRALVGRFSMVPLVLKREPRKTHHGGKTQTHHTMRIEFVGDIDHLNALRGDTTRVLSGPRYALPSPEVENPVFDDGPVYTAEGEVISPEGEILSEPAPEKKTDKTDKSQEEGAGAVPADDEGPVTIELLMVKVTEAKVLPHLKNIWEKYVDVIKQLPSEDLAALELAKDAKKAEFLGVEEDK